MPTRRGAGMARVVAAVALMLVLYAWGRDENQQASAAAPVPECAPPLYEEIAKDTAYPDRVVEAAHAWDFNLKGNSLHLEPPINWDLNPNRSTSFQGKYNDLTWLDPLLFAYHEGDRRALEQATEVVLDWIEGNPFANPYTEGKVRGDSKPWIDKVSAARVQFIAWIAAAAECEGMLSGPERDMVRSSLETHGNFLADQESYHQTNHGLYVDRGLYLLTGLAPELEQARVWQDLAPRRFTRTLRLRQVGAEGFWLEHSAQYQLAIDRLVDDFLELTGDEEPRLRRVAKAMRLASGWMIEPDGQILLYGDSNVSDPSAAELKSSRTRQGLEFMPKTGLAFVRRQDPGAYLAMISSFHSDAHKDADELSFDLYDAGHRIVSDTGLYHKDFDRYFEFQDSQRAHSGLAVAGSEIPIVDSNSFGSGLYAAGSGAGWHAVWGTNPLLEQLGVDHRRLWVYRPGYALVVVDLVRSEGTHTYERYVQLGPDIAAEDSEGALSLSAEGLDATLTSYASVDQELDLVRGERRPLGGFVFPKFREAVPRTTATYTTEASDLDAVMTFGLDPAEQVRAELLPEPSDLSLGLRLQDADGVDVGRILVTRDGEELGVAVSPELEGERLQRNLAAGD